MTKTQIDLSNPPISTYWDPLVARLLLTCAECGSFMVYKFTYPDHENTYLPISIFECTDCGSRTGMTASIKAPTPTPGFLKDAEDMFGYVTGPTLFIFCPLCRHGMKLTQANDLVDHYGCENCGQLLALYKLDGHVQQAGGEGP